MAVDATACPNQSTASTTVEEGQEGGGGKHEKKKVTVLLHAVFLNLESTASTAMDWNLVEWWVGGLKETGEALSLSFFHASPLPLLIIKNKGERNSTRLQSIAVDAVDSSQLHKKESDNAFSQLEINKLTA